MSATAIAVRYAAFAALATAINVLTQAAALQVYDGPYPLIFAMIAGTGTGLVAKYLLDKRWIFYDTSSGVGMHARKFGLYTTMGLFTTALFWATELVFEAISRNEYGRYIGAVIGLTLGYVIKYWLDRRFVFGVVR